MGSPLALVAAVLAAFTCTLQEAVADEVRLKDGRVLIGKVEAAADGSLTVHTLDGPVAVDAANVLRIRDDRELRRELTRLRRQHGDSPFAQLELARTALAFGLEREMWQYLDNLCETPDGPPAAAAVQRSLDEFLLALRPVLLTPVERELPAPAQADLLLRQLRSHTGDGNRAARLAQLVALEGVDETLYIHSRRASLQPQRHLALEALALRGHQTAPAAVYRSAVLGPKRADRSGAAALARRLDRAQDATLYIAGGLFHDAPDVRIHTAEALADLGAIDVAVPLLVRAGPLAGTPAAAGGDIGTRGYMAQINIKSYVRDFDVEIAQASAVANPIIGALKTGVTLDAKVAAVITEHRRIALAYRRALHDLTDSDPGADPKEWLEWLRQRDPEAASRAAAGNIAPASPETAQPNAGGGSR